MEYLTRIVRKQGEGGYSLRGEYTKDVIDMVLHIYLSENSTAFFCPDCGHRNIIFSENSDTCACGTEWERLQYEWVGRGNA